MLGVEIAVEALTRRLGRPTIVQDASRTSVRLGPRATGTSAVRALLGLGKPEAGSVTIDGRDVTGTGELHLATTSTRVPGQQVDGSRVRGTPAGCDGRRLVSKVVAL